MNSTATILARLSAVASALATWKGYPAIFDEAAPDDFLDQEPKPTRPFLVIAVPTRDEPQETFTEVGRQVVQDVRGYQRHNGDASELDALMRSVRGLFHNQPSALTVSGGVCDVCRVTGPVLAPTTDPSLIGRRVTIRLDLRNT